MTQKEIEKFLSNTKVFVNGKSKEIQEKLFSFGFYWFVNDVRVLHTEKPFLYLENNKEITYGNDMKFFTEHEYRQISAEEILSLELTEQTYRPFKTQEECWQEMLKHQPFGWIKRPDGELFCIDRVFDGGVAYRHSSCMFDEYIESGYTFADGTPFGIKEE